MGRLSVAAQVPPFGSSATKFMRNDSGQRPVRSTARRKAAKASKMASGHSRMAAKVQPSAPAALRGLMRSTAARKTSPVSTSGAPHSGKASKAVP